MWPWEHLAVGYLLYTGRLRLRSRPVGLDAPALVVVGTQLPDLIDKPLAWGIGALPNGRSLGHSLLFVVPLLIAFWVLARRTGRGELGVAFAVGYLSHLPTDAFYPLVYGDSPRFGFLFWPVVPGVPSRGHLLSHLLSSLRNTLSLVSRPLGVAYLLFDVALLAVALYAFVADRRSGRVERHRAGDATGWTGRRSGR